MYLPHNQPKVCAFISSKREWIQPSCLKVFAWNSCLTSRPAPHLQATAFCYCRLICIWWNYTYTIFGLVSFTQDNYSVMHLFCHMNQLFILFGHWVLFHWMDIPHWLYPFSCRWILRLLLLFNSYEAATNFPIQVFVWHVFFVFLPGNGMTGSYSRYVLTQ